MLEESCTFGLAFKVTGHPNESQRISGVALVLRELCHQLVRRLELPCRTQSRHEIDSHLSSIKIAARVEQMHLERCRRISERRPRSKVHHSTKGTGGCLKPHGQKPLRRAEHSSG